MHRCRGRSPLNWLWTRMLRAISWTTFVVLAAADKWMTLYLAYLEKPRTLCCWTITVNYIDFQTVGRVHVIALRSFSGWTFPRVVAQKVISRIELLAYVYFCALQSYCLRFRYYALCDGIAIVYLCCYTYKVGQKPECFFKVCNSRICWHIKPFHISNSLQALYMLRQIRPSVCLSVRHTPVLCHNEKTQRDTVSTIGSRMSVVFWRQEWWSR